MGALTKIFQLPISDNTHYDSYGLFGIGSVFSCPGFQGEEAEFSELFCSKMQGTHEHAYIDTETYQLLMHPLYDANLVCSFTSCAKTTIFPHSLVYKLIYTAVMKYTNYNSVLSAFPL